MNQAPAARCEAIIIDQDGNRDYCHSLAVKDYGRHSSCAQHFIDATLSPTNGKFVEWR